MAGTDVSTTEFVERMPRHPLVWNNHSMAWISDKIAGIVEDKAPRWWWISIAITASFAGFGIFCIFYLLYTGVGVWGNNIPVAWAWDITNFVFWIGIGHAGTLIWDVFAVSTYFTVSVLFWYLGLVPDLATMRDRAKGKISRIVYWIMSFGWRGGNRQWRHYEMAYLVL